MCTLPQQVEAMFVWGRALVFAAILDCKFCFAEVVMRGVFFFDYGEGFWAAFIDIFPVYMSSAIGAQILKNL